MENNELREELIIGAASKVHEEWCNGELEGYYNRAVNAVKEGKNDAEALLYACIKGDEVRNEVSLKKFPEGYLDSFDNFMKAFKSGDITIKRFAKRDLTDEEIARDLITGNYDLEKGENILRDFLLLSNDSKKENLDAAIGAYNVFEDYSKAGVSVSSMENDPKIKEQIGVAIHADWLKRNPEHPNDSLKVPYNELDEWTQAQDLSVFSALLQTVKENEISIDKVAGYTVKDAKEEEAKALDAIKNRKTVK